MTDDEIDIMFIKELHDNNYFAPIVTNMEMVQRWKRAGYDVVTSYHWPLDKGSHYLSFKLSKEKISIKCPFENNHLDSIEDSY